VSADTVGNIIDFAGPLVCHVLHHFDNSFTQFGRNAVSQGRCCMHGRKVYWLFEDKKDEKDEKYEMIRFSE
jgi:hypothetical protein